MTKRLLAIALLLSSPAWGAPAPEGVTGTMTTGQTITVTGTGFGTRPAAKPVLWADFEGGTVNPTDLGLRTSWDATGYMGSTSTYHYAGARAVGSMAGWLNQATGGYLALATGLGYGQDLYVHYKRLSTQAVYYTATASQNTKTWRMWSTSVGGTNQNLYAGTTNSGGSIVIAEQIGTPVTNKTRFYGDGAITQPTAGTWRSEEWIIHHSSGLNAQDGTLTFKIDNQAVMSVTGFQMDETGKAGPSNILMLQQVLANNSSSQWCDTGYFAFDDVYVDTPTVARAMVCNASTFAASTACEVQVPSAWSATELALTANTGAIAGTKYLYVCDTTNACNANGLEIGAAPETPAAVTTRTIHKNIGRVKRKKVQR